MNEEPIVTPDPEPVSVVDPPKPEPSEEQGAGEGAPGDGGEADGFGLADVGNDQQPEEGKPKEAKPEEKKDPEQYELEATEDFPMPEENLKSFSAACRNAGLTKEQAEAVLNWHKAQYKEDETWRVQQEENVKKTWARELGKDEEFGGKNLKATQAEVVRALAVVDPEGKLRDILRDTPWQYHPEIIKAVARVGRLMGEHEFVGQNGEGGDARKPLWKRMYGNEGTGLPKAQE